MFESTVGKDVIFGRKGKREYRGKVKYEVQFLEPYNSNSDRDFMDLVQGIKWEDEKFSIRICYYIKNHGKPDSEWKFANRPLSTTEELFGELLKKAQKEEWFPKLS
jgi:hypothetical protein